MTRKRIGVVGFAAAGVSFLAQFLEHLEAPEAFELLVFDASPHGLGDAYGPQPASHLMNTAVEVTSLYEEKPDDFRQWLAANAGGVFGGRDFVPRFWFGRYLEARRAEILERAERVGLAVRRHAVSITDLRRDGERYVLRSDAEEFDVDAVLLFTGCFKRSLYPALGGRPGFVDSIYGGSLQKEVASVLVLGTKLSAIDAILQLAEAHPSARIVAASRTGEFPAPNRAIDLKRREPNRWLNREAFDALRRRDASVSAEEILFELVKRAVEERGCLESVAYLLGQRSADRLRAEIVALDSGEADYETLVLPAVELLESVWWDLGENDRATLLKKHFRGIMHFVGAFPIENARKIQALIESGRLRVVEGLESVEATPSGFEARFESSAPVTADAVLDCSGYDNGLTHGTVSPLMKKIVERNLFELNGCGGFRVDRDFRLIGVGGARSNAFSAGFPIKGSVPFANWFNRIVMATNRIGAAVKGAPDATR